MVVALHFTDDDLDAIQQVHDTGGPREAFRMWHALDRANPIETSDVEDFIIEFYQQYNSRFGTRY